VMGRTLRHGIRLGAIGMQSSARLGQLLLMADEVII
jgi:hypothetical protein